MASGVLNTIRMVGLAVGVALTGVLVRGLEYDRLTDLLSAAGATIGAAERAEIPVCSRARRKRSALARLAPAAEAQVNRSSARVTITDSKRA